MNTQIIITRYNEYIDWIDYVIDAVDSIVIYNKGSNDNIFKRYIPTEQNMLKITIKKMANIGRIDHTLAYHIVENWNNLPDILVSLPASILMCLRKGSYLSAIRKKLPLVKDYYHGFYSPRFRKVSPDFNYTIDYYQSESNCNRNGNPFIKSEYSDFKAWKKALVDDRPIRYIAMRGMFSVCKENITHIDKSIYENLLKSLSVGDNIENGHFAERIWGHLFRQYAYDTRFTKPAEIKFSQQCDTQPIEEVF